MIKMKITKAKLKQIIKEELEGILREGKSSPEGEKGFWVTYTLITYPSDSGAPKRVKKTSKKFTTESAANGFSKNLKKKHKGKVRGLKITNEKPEK
jgi:hypothetical protein